MAFVLRPSRRSAASTERPFNSNKQREQRRVARQGSLARGYGETQPIEDNKTEARRALNRRVGMFVLDNPGDVQVQGEGKVEERQFFSIRGR